MVWLTDHNCPTAKAVHVLYKCQDIDLIRVYEAKSTVNIWFTGQTKAKKVANKMKPPAPNSLG